MKNLIRKYLGITTLSEKIHRIEQATYTHIRSVVFLLRKLSVTPSEYVSGRDGHDKEMNEYIKGVSETELSRALANETDPARIASIRKLQRRIADEDIAFSVRATDEE